MAYMHIGKDFTPPDVPGKVTGRIKYAEDYTREGMVYARLLTSPIPHARGPWPWPGAPGSSLEHRWTLE